MMKKCVKTCAALAAMALISIMIAESISYARAGGGRSFGGRGSRSYSSPTTPSTPYRQPSTNSPQFPNQPGSSFMRSLGGGLLGGMIGSMLFRGTGYGSTGWGGGTGGGIGLLEIILIAGIGYVAFKMYRRYKSSGESPFSTNRGGMFGGTANEPYNRQSDISDIKMSDPSFDEGRFKDSAMDMFFKIQAAWMNRDLSTAKTLLTEEMKEIMQDDINSLLSSKRINRLENIAVRSVDISEAWQESGQDYITVLIYANILDYTIDEQSGTVVEGSKTAPSKFEEYWTFTRPSRSGQWMLSGINQV